MLKKKLEKMTFVPLSPKHKKRFVESKVIDRMFTFSIMAQKGPLKNIILISV